MSANFLVTNESAGQRLDVFLVAQEIGASRSGIQKAIKAGEITVNGKEVKPKYVLKAGDTVYTPSLASGEDSPLLKGEQIALSIPILFENKDVVVINKPAGVAVHAGVGISAGTIADWFVVKYSDAIGVGEEEGRWGIVHRLDKDTSGVMILAKTQDAYDHLKMQFQKRRVHKEYLALVHNIPSGAKGRINQPIARSRRNPMRRAVDVEGKPAVTNWFLEETFGEKYALLRVVPETGRTHQIRVHMHWFGYPLVGDQLYTFKRQGQPKHVTRHMLHADVLTLRLPSGERKSFQAEVSEDFSIVLDGLRKLGS